MTWLGLGLAVGAGELFRPLPELDPAELDLPLADLRDDLAALDLPDDLPVLELAVLEVPVLAGLAEPELPCASAGRCADDAFADPARL